MVFYYMKEKNEHHVEVGIMYNEFIVGNLKEI